MSGYAALPKFGPREKARVGAGGTASEDRPLSGSGPAGARPSAKGAADEAARRDASPYQGEAKENTGEGNGHRTDSGCSLKLESSRKPKALGWWQRLFRRRRNEVREPIQAEFSLDLVKVVRNDLSDGEETRNTERKKDTPKREHQQESVFGGPVR